MNDTIPVILDVDTGVDDALAILFAVAHPRIDLLGISCVAGNASLDQVVLNTLAILDLIEAPTVPVAAGSVRPLIEKARSAAHVHGEGGLGTLELPLSARAVDPDHAVTMMRREILASPRPVTIIALAPQTNIALLLRQYPEVADNLERIVFMGGSASTGNATAVAEFNVWHDPEAAAIVVDSGVPTYMYGLDVFNKVGITPEASRAMRESESPLAQAVGTLLDGRPAGSDAEEDEYAGLIGDAGAVCAVVDPEALRTRVLPVKVQLSGDARGQTLVDRRTSAGEDSFHGSGAPWFSVEVALEVDAGRVVDLFVSTLGIG